MSPSQRESASPTLFPRLIGPKASLCHSWSDALRQEDGRLMLLELHQTPNPHRRTGFSKMQSLRRIPGPRHLGRILWLEWMSRWMTYVRKMLDKSEVCWISHWIEVAQAPVRCSASCLLDSQAAGRPVG